MVYKNNYAIRCIVNVHFIQNSSFSNNYKMFNALYTTIFSMGSNILLTLLFIGILEKGRLMAWFSNTISKTNFTTKLIICHFQPFGV